MKRHSKISRLKDRAEVLKEINQNEISFLKRESIPFHNGAEFIDTSHFYTHDLDIFGKHSLYHNINRTETFKGSIKLAEFLSSKRSNEEILKNQEAIKELAGKDEWRQEIMALGRIQKDSKETYKRLLNWANSSNAELPVRTKILAFAGPLAFAGLLLGYIISGDPSFSKWAGYIFVLNLGILSSSSKFIKREIANTTDIYEVIHRYGLIIEEIEKQNFKSAKLTELQQQLKYNNFNASTEIRKLSELFSRMDNINNLFALILFNGSFLFHIHTLNRLLNWKRKHSKAIETWLDTIAEIEALNSFSNLYYNNPDFVFPQINNSYKIEFENIAHPLLNPASRVGNDVTFNPGFMVLTGSNMSGKSTFLRSLGVNMVLAGAGGPVCAKRAVVHPLPVLVSMRLSDSLSDSESYFFAEIKRLKHIMDSLSQSPAFILLDEILRGTNSDDKRTGTIEVVKKIATRKAIGAIATHDIEVCNTTFDYPDDLSNHCFEVEIVNNELIFDYKLREGICKNKSATFLMEKMGVI